MRLAAGGGDEVRFELRLGAERVSDGIARVEDTPPAAQRHDRGEDHLSLEEFPPLDELVPHRAPALLLQRLIARTEDGLAAVAAVPRDSPFIRHGRAPALLALEMAAQSAAALEALAGHEGPPRLGYLVGIRGATLPHAWLPIQTPLRVEVRRAGSVPPLAVFDLTVAGDSIYATGTLSVLLT